MYFHLRFTVTPILSRAGPSACRFIAVVVVKLIVCCDRLPLLSDALTASLNTHFLGKAVVNALEIKDYPGLKDIVTPS